MDQWQMVSAEITGFDAKDARVCAAFVGEDGCDNPVAPGELSLACLSFFAT